MTNQFDLQQEKERQELRQILGIDPKQAKERQELRKVLGGANYSRGVSEATNDIGQTIKKGLVAVPQMGVGLLSLQNQGRTGKWFQNNIWDMQKTKENIQEQMSDTAKMQQGQFDRAEGFTGKLGVLAKNPMLAVDATVESLPSILAGGVMGRAVGGVAGIGSDVARAAIGEGMAMGGSAAENLRSQNADGLLTGKDIIAAVGTGVGGAGLGYAGGRFAQRLGIADADTLLTGGVRQTATSNAKGGIGYGLAGIGKGAVAEGVFEELPQTILETGLENWAKGRALTENMAGNAALGLVSGGMMGGVAGGVSSNWRKPPTPDTDTTNNQTDSAPQLPYNGGNTPLLPDGSPINPNSPTSPNSPIMAMVVLILTPHHNMTTRR